MTTNKSVNFKVLGMHCGGCANKIKTAVAGLGVEHVVDVNVDSSRVNVKFNSEESTIAAVKDSIIKAGFQVESIEFE
jgi:copper chaperone